MFTDSEWGAVDPMSRRTEALDAGVAAGLTTTKAATAQVADAGENPHICQRTGCLADGAAIVEIHDRMDGTIFRRELCADDRNALIALFGRRHV